MHDMEANLHHPDLKPRKAINTSSVDVFATDWALDYTDEYTSHWGLLHASERRVRYDRIRGLMMQSRWSKEYAAACLSALDNALEAASDYYQDEGQKRRKEIDKELLAQRRKERLDFERPGRPTSLILDLGWVDRLDDCDALLASIAEREAADDADLPSIAADLFELHRRLAALSGSALYRAKRMTTSRKDDLLKAAKAAEREARAEARALKAELAALKADA